MSMVVEIRTAPQYPRQLTTNRKPPFAKKAAFVNT